MYPEFVESFNKNLNITYNLRDETQKGVSNIVERKPNCKIINCFESVPNCEELEEGQFLLRTQLSVPYRLPLQRLPTRP